MTSVLEVSTLAALAATVYHHAGYSLLLRALTRKQVADTPPVIAADSLPRISIVIPAYREGAFIAAKIANCAALLYPPEKLEILVLDDGSPDDTSAQAARAAETDALKGISFRLIRFAENRGKVAVLNDAFPLVTGSIILFSDASALLSIDALQRIAGWFSNPDCALVSSCYQLLSPKNPGEARWWHRQTTTLFRESLLAAPIGAHGAGFAVRKSALRPLPPDSVNDDFLLAMGAIARGGRGVYDPEITALELDPTSEPQDFRRRIRIGTGNLQQLVRLPGLLNPRRPILAFLFLSGKGSRPLMPIAMLWALIGTGLLAADGSLVFGSLFAMQVAGYALGLLSPLLKHSSLCPSPIRRASALIDYLVRGHLAGAIGAGRFLLGRHRAPWRRISLPSAD